MPLKKGKGGKKRTRTKKAPNTAKRELVLKEEDQEYAKVAKMLGGGRLEGKCYDGKTRLCKIRGKLLKRVWIKVGDIILVGLREYEDNKADVIHKYSAEEARALKAKGVLPEYANVEDRDASSDEKECVFDFEEI
mmetsp:Transcript_13113/g.23808  ORF Transcript_13113/g.23808 Transcript_13113/m.23808 type:complete len:135 (+) Transcript_13113:856-1260(+)|eukprot:CAMPEP_0197538234 /NCGR_PEP_ID=MMETSP1318-20131121/59246_1 /TAXON_ID=552666 /ORGANISM="Partenskyella glossopodia, Strain RCC365" /LENGTH=134 /DNA_ID=CAMNT_0043096601 /DNA_START=61 /DNA_END=465 /DNA_ORIENTATION=+